ncbi:hypothetical protein [Brachyspira murdochii]|uniref:Uncharacterized protein n=1 Tax=Brachyspira murdochii (strain ATCC 51284 / DSM 12563 / 56-150) TaxID=526224 RepID=D5U8K7_BRAM5|nr:hypothetical protein [Brachyspira murdochii]ADG71030.1 conserved hypothetical protein [Brachyspira murdochii DSM 12563]
MQDKELLNILDIFIKEKNQIIEKIKKERKKLIPKINIIEYSMYPEILRNKLLYDILKVNFVIDNSNKEINFARDFADYIIKDMLNFNNINTDKDINIEADIIEDNIKIEMSIYNNDFKIIIESKINIFDLKKQLKNYSNDNLFIVILSKNDYESNILDNKLKNYNNVCCLSNSDIAYFIDNNIINKYGFLKDDKYSSIYSALIQIRNNEINISSKKEEYNMEKSIIEEFLNNNEVYKSLNTMKDIEECSKLFLEASSIIKSQKIEINPIKNQIEIIKNIIKYLKSHGLSNDNCRYLDEKIFKENIKNSNTAASTPIIIYLNKQLLIKLFINIHYCHVSIFSNSNDIIDKLNQKEVKDEIKNIFSPFELFEGKNDPDPLDYLYVYYFYINKDDKPEEIANIIIKIYNYLKKQDF